MTITYAILTVNPYKVKSIFNDRMLLIVNQLKIKQILLDIKTWLIFNPRSERKSFTTIERTKTYK